MKAWTPALLLLAAVCLLPSWLVGFGALGAVVGWWVTTKILAAMQRRRKLQAEFDATWAASEKRHRSPRLYRVK